MLLKLVVASLALASVAYGCVPGAVKDANGDCQCVAGLSGNPDLCCYDASYRGCHVSGDPVLTSFAGNKIGLDFPCGTMISSSKRDNNNPIVNVFAAGKEMGGTIYTSQVKVQIRQLSVVTITFNFETEPSFVHFEQTAAPAEDFTMNDGETKYMSAAGILGDITITFDLGLHMYTFSTGGIEVNIRPSVGNNPQQSYNPGVCVMEPLESTSPSPGSTYSCSLNKDVTNKPVGEYLDSAIQPMKNYIFNSGILKDTTSSQMADQCQTFQDIMVDNCEAADRYNALKKCAFIMFQSLIRKCFKESGNEPVMASFNECLNVYCKGTKELCEGLKADPKYASCAPNLDDCEVWPPYRRLNSFVAGEGGEGFLNADGDENNNQGESETTPFNFDIFGNNDQDQGNQAGGIPDFELPPF